MPAGLRVLKAQVNAAVFIPLMHEVEMNIASLGCTAIVIDLFYSIFIP